MKFLSVCSGVGGLDMPLFEKKFECIGFFETDPHASAVLNYHHFGVNNYGDLKKYKQIKQIACQDNAVHAGDHKHKEAVKLPLCGIFFHVIYRVY